MGHSTIAELKLEKLRYLQSLRDQLAGIERDAAEGIRLPWAQTARPEQLPPPGDWRVWLILAGRGWGKTRSAAEWCVTKALRYPGCRIALVARTIGDARDTMCEGDSGLLACLSSGDFRGGKEDKGYNRSLGEIYLANGSRFKTFTSEKPWRLRGPQHHLAWADEAAFWSDAHKGTIADTTWSNLNIATRLKPRLDWDDEFRPQIVIATTPRPVTLLRSSDPEPSRLGLMQRESTVITRGRTMDNISNLSSSYYENVVAPLIGTRLGRQELDAELLDDVPGALWKRDWIDDHRITDPSLVPDLIRVVVGVDPAVTDGESSAQTGIVVAGAARNGRGYVLGDFTLRASPMEAIKKAISVYREFSADRIVAEVNNGGDYIGTLVRTIDPNVPFYAVRATRGKAIRAEPISSLYQQGRISHVGSFPRLEDEMCSWTPLDPVSPDMLDACLAAGTLVLTADGETPIEKVIPGSLVWTRAGWKQVLASRCTGIQDTVTVELSNGRVLTGTADHQIWIDGNGWRRLDALMWGDKLSGWKTAIPSRLNSTGKSTAGIPTRHTGSIASTILLTRSAMQKVTHSTEIPGNMLTGRKFPTATTYITSTSTRSTMMRQISLPYRLPNTSSFTIPRRDESSIGRTGWNQSSQQLLNGTVVKQDELGTANMLSEYGEKTPGNRSSKYVLSAVLNLRLWLSRVRYGTAHHSAGIKPGLSSTDIRSSSSASSAVGFTGILSILANDMRPAPVNAVASGVISSLDTCRAFSCRVLSAEKTSGSVAQMLTSSVRAHENAVLSRRAVGGFAEKKSALSAGMYFSKSRNITSPVPVSVVGFSVNKKRQPVYDLMVDEAHEFVANGVIVHNCVWAITALKDLLGGSYLSAYGAARCDACGNVYLSTENGQPRLACPSCKAPLPEFGATAAA